MLLKLEVALQFAEKCMIFCVYPRAQAREGPDGLNFLLRPRVLCFQPNGSASYFEHVYVHHDVHSRRQNRWFFLGR